MKGQVWSYGGIVLTVVLLSIFMLRLSAGDTVDRGVVSSEGKMTSFVNYADMLIKTFNSSIEFISQRAAYDLLKTGGIEGSEPAIWNINSPPTTDELKQQLINRIKENLPQGTTEGDITITWGDASIDVYDCDNHNCFLVNGGKTIFIYEQSIDSRISLNPFKINSQIDSNYYKLINAGRAILTDSRYNQYLGDWGLLLDTIYGASDPSITSSFDPRFENLDFEGDSIGDIVTITIYQKKNCYPITSDMYCLSPLKPGETRFDPSVPYDYNKLIFRYQKVQTGATPLDFDFSISVNPSSNSIQGGICSITTPSSCGNGIIDPGEDCDTSNLNGKSCTDFNTFAVPFVDGILGCNNCKFDTSCCVTAGDACRVDTSSGRNKVIGQVCNAGFQTISGIDPNKFSQTYNPGHSELYDSCLDSSALPGGLYYGQLYIAGCSQGLAYYQQTICTNGCLNAKCV
jgi:hypothetical protein